MSIVIRRSLNTLRAIRSIQSVLQIRNFRMSAKLRSEQAIEEMKKKNPYFDKYAEKLAALQKTSPEEFLNRLETVEEKKKPKKEEKARFVTISLV